MRMARRYRFLECSAALWLLGSSAVRAQEETLELTFRLNGQPLQLPYVDGTEALMVPVRDLLEALDPQAEIEWDKTTRTLTARVPPHELRLVEDEKNAWVNGEEWPLALPMTNEKVSEESANTQVLAPLRDLAEALGATVQWDEGTVSISTPRYWISRLGLKTSLTERYDRFHVSLGSLYKGEEQILWCRSDAAVFVQIYEVEWGQLPRVVLGLGPNGEEVYFPDPGRLGRSYRARPRLLEPGRTRRWAMAHSSEGEVAYVALACRQEPAEDPLEMFQKGQADEQSWVITGVSGQVEFASISYGEYRVSAARVSLEQIATEKGVTEDHLREVNGLGPEEDVQVGDVLYYEIGFEIPPPTETVVATKLDEPPPPPTPPCIGRVKGGGGNLRRQKNGNVVRDLEGDTYLAVWKQEGEWYKVRWGGKDYYMRTHQVALTRERVEWQPERRDPEQQGGGPPVVVSGPGRPDVIAIARGWLGTPYVLGGQSRRGIDCSGFVEECYKKVGVKLGGTCRVQCFQGTRVHEKGQPLNLLQPGDRLYFYKAGGRLKSNRPSNHTGLYMGNGRMIHAEGGTGVNIDKFPGNYYGTIYLWAMRGG